MTEVRVCATTDIAPGSVGAVTATDAQGNALNLAIIHSENGKWFAMINRCSHGRFKLSEGWVEGETIECTRHGSQFDLESGEALTPPASIPVQTYPVIVDGTDVYVAI